MNQNPAEKSSVAAELITVLISVIAGSGIGWIVWTTTKNNAIAIGITAPIAALTNSFLRKVIK